MAGGSWRVRPAAPLSPRRRGPAIVRPARHRSDAREATGRSRRRPLSIWQDIGRVVSRVSGDAFSNVVEAVRTVFAGDRKTRRKVAFSIAIIALSAKMAKADGIVTPEEVRAFQEVFHVPEREFNNVSRLYNLARQDVAGYESYARQVRSLFPGEEPSDEEVLLDVLDALFHIAKADGVLHDDEVAFLRNAAATFGFDDLAFERVRARHVAGEEGDPFAVLGADASMPYDEIKALYRRHVAENHPDRLIARGMPEEFVQVAVDRTAALNDAWAAIDALHEGGSSAGGNEAATLR